MILLTGSCNFETDMCGWMDASDDDFDWTLYRGSTSSGGTGPTSDHTRGSNLGIHMFL